jgi:phosphatidylinositol-3,4,5-trisphosphate 3-phosphatase and dual-specificity protein phosphatase PTEN
MGWLWFIPAFHMESPPPSSNSTSAQKTKTKTTTKFLLQRKDLDFALGLGSSILSVELTLEWLPPAANDSTKAEFQPAEATSEGERRLDERLGEEPGDEKGKGGAIVEGVQVVAVEGMKRGGAGGGEGGDGAVVEGVKAVEAGMD